MHWFYHNWSCVTNVALFLGIKEISSDKFLERSWQSISQQEVLFFEKYGKWFIPNRPIAKNKFIFFLESTFKNKLKSKISDF
jgi:hypothetical protein